MPLLSPKNSGNRHIFITLLNIYEGAFFARIFNSLPANWSFLQYVRNIFWKINISYYLICTRTIAYQGVRNVNFSKNVWYVLNKWSQISCFNPFTPKFLALILSLPALHWAGANTGLSLNSNILKMVRVIIAFKRTF